MIIFVWLRDSRLLKLATSSFLAHLYSLDIVNSFVKLVCWV